MEDDTEVECAILTIFPVDAKEYIALLPLDEEGQNHDGEVYLYSFTRTAEGAPMLSNIESDEEYNKAAIAFDTVLQNAREAEAAGTPLELSLIHIYRCKDSAEEQSTDKGKRKL